MGSERNHKKNKLMVFERKVLRRIFGPTKERDGTWRIKTNDALDELIRYKNIINHIKAQILSWFGHLHRMLERENGKKRNVYLPSLMVKVPDHLLVYVLGDTYTCHT
jgi:hypothetical protein